jgi:hypothetical protein
MALSMKKWLTEIEIAPEIIIQAAQNLQQNLPDKLFTYSKKFDTPAVLLFGNIHFL